MHYVVISSPYLANRSHFVLPNNTRSSSYSVRLDVAQGCIQVAIVTVAKPAVTGSPRRLFTSCVWFGLLSNLTDPNSGTLGLVPRQPFYSVSQGSFGEDGGFTHNSLKMYRTFESKATGFDTVGVKAPLERLSRYVCL